MREKEQRQEARLTLGPHLSFSGLSIAALIPLSHCLSLALSLCPSCQVVGFLHACKAAVVAGRMGGGGGGDGSCR